MQVLYETNWFAPVLTLACKQSFGVSVAATLFVLGALGAPVSNLRLHALQVVQERYWFDPVLTSSCGQTSCYCDAFGGGGGPASAVAINFAPALTAVVEATAFAFAVTLDFATGIAR